MRNSSVRINCLYSKHIHALILLLEYIPWHCLHDTIQTHVYGLWGAKKKITLKYGLMGVSGPSMDHLLVGVGSVQSLTKYFL